MDLKGWRDWKFSQGNQCFSANFLDGHSALFGNKKHNHGVSRPCGEDLIAYGTDHGSGQAKLGREDPPLTDHHRQVPPGYSEI